MLEALIKGLAIGFGIAVPVGPIGLLCIRRSLDGGFVAGFSAGLGAATADFTYGMIVALGFGALAAAIDPVRAPLQLAGGIALLWLAWRGLHSADPDARPAPARSYLTTFFLTLSNPATILSFLSIVASLGLTLEGWGPAALAGGVFLGSAAWWLLLAGGVSLARRQIGPRTRRGLDYLSAALLGGFGLWALGAAAWELAG